MKKTIAALSIGLAALLSFPAALIISQHASKGYGISVFNRTINDFEWIDISGNPHKFSEWDNSATFLFVGYLSCKIICHQRIQQMLSIESSLVEEHRNHDVNFLFVTIDPDNDTKEILNFLIDSRSNDFYSARLKPEDLNKLQEDLQDIASINSTLDILHTGDIYLLTNKRKIQRIYTGNNLNSELIIKDIPNQFFSSKYIAAIDI